MVILLREIFNRKHLAVLIRLLSSVIKPQLNLKDIVSMMIVPSGIYLITNKIIVYPCP